MITDNINEFKQVLKKNNRILGIDYGSRKLGFAISDKSHKIAMPLEVISDGNQNARLRYIADVINQQGVVAIVIGLPLNMDGSQGAQAEIVIKFAVNLERKFKLPVFLQDERMTSKAASSLLKMAGYSRKERDGMDDIG